MAYTGQQNKPGKIGHVTTVLYQDKNIGIDGKIYQLLDARVDRVRQDNPQLGDEVEYKISSSKDLSEKGKISFFAIKKRAGSDGVQQPVTEVPPQPAEEKKAEPPANKVVQGEYLSHTGQSVTLKDCKGNAEAWRADIGILKFLSNPDCEIKAGMKVKALLVQQKGGEWVMSKIGTPDPNLEEKPFKTGGELLEQNLKEKQAETAQAEAALAQIKKEEEMAAARIAENQEYLKNITGDQKPMPTTEPTQEPEKCQQNESSKGYDLSTVELKEPSKVGPEDILPATGGVELKIHVDLGSFNHFEMKVCGINGDHARQLLDQESKPTIALVKRIIKDASKGY